MPLSAFFMFKIKIERKIKKLQDSKGDPINGKT